MIGTLARKRTNLAAFAVLAALAVALFAATISSQTGPRITSTTDTDFIIGDGGTITVSVTDAGGTSYVFQPIFGFVLTGTTTNGPAVYTHSAGAPTGDFTIRATATGATPLTKTLTVGDAGTNLAEVKVNLGTTFTATDGTVTRATAAQIAAGTGVGPETDTSNVGTVIYIQLEALNSLGNATNVGTGAADMSVSVFAVGGFVAQGDTAGTSSNATATSSSNAVTGAANKIDFVVTRTADQGAGPVEVFAVATIGTTSVRSESLNLTFTVVAGAPAIVSLEDGAAAAQGGASIALEDDESTAIDPAVAATRAILPVSATDADGNNAILLVDTAITATVKGPDDKDVSDNGITNVAVARYDLDTATATGNQSGIVVTLPADAAPGDYTVEATLGTSKSSATFTVTGAATMVDVAIDAPDGTGLGAQITITATVTDVNGNLVAPTLVTFTSGNSPVTLVGGNSNTKDGVSTRTAVVTGTGVITIVAAVGDEPNVVSGVDVLVAGADGATADEPSLSDLSRHSGVASYTGPDATASELLALLAGRATIIWLSDGDNWTAYYALIDGDEAPGSSNFTVTSGDVLYIGN